MDSSPDIAREDVAAPGWNRPLRAIHLLLAIAVTAQLFIGSFMRSPHPGRPDSFGFMFHEALGGAILLLVALHWAWAFRHPREGLRPLLPWTPPGMRQVATDLRSIAGQRRLPPGGAGNVGLASFVHGLGLLAISAVIVVGAVFFVMRAAGADHATLEVIKDVHDVFAVVVWIYWGGHLAATLAHTVLRQPVWRTMFDLRTAPGDAVGRRPGALKP